MRGPRPLLRRAVQRTISGATVLAGNPSGASRPAFLVGVGRSGTNMLVAELERHRQIELYGEDHRAAFRGWRLVGLDRVAELTERSRARVVLFKPILETYRSARFLETFPDGRILFALRRVDEVAASHVEKWGAQRVTDLAHMVATDFASFSDPAVPEPTRAAVRRLWSDDHDATTAAALYWYLHGRLWFDLGLDGDDRARLVVYEDVTADPATELGELCTFLGLSAPAGLGADVAARRSGDRVELPGPVRTACDELYDALTARRP